MAITDSRCEVHGVSKIVLDGPIGAAANCQYCLDLEEPLSILCPGVDGVSESRMAKDCRSINLQQVHT